MNELLMKLLEEAKTDKKAYKSLKLLAVELRQMELAMKLRDLERELFPESEEAKKAKEEAKKLSLLFKMVELNISEDICWLIANTLRVYNRRRGNFDLKDGCELIAKKKEIFE